MVAMAAAIVLSTAAWAHGAATNVYVVAGSVPLGMETGTQADPFHSIQQAIDACAAIDPDGGCHTINVAAGTYDYGEEESFQVLPYNDDNKDGLGGSGWRSVALINIASNANLNGLRLIGEDKDTTVIDAEWQGETNRVMYIAAHDVLVRSITIRGGKLYSEEEHNRQHAGAGVLIHGKRVKLEDMKIMFNVVDGHIYRAMHIVATTKEDGSALFGNDLWLTDTEIAWNTNYNTLFLSSTVYLYGGLVPTSHVANAHVHDNAGLQGITLDGGGGSTLSNRCVVFGCLVENNGTEGIYGDGGNKGIYIVNNTITQNGTNGFYSLENTHAHRLLNNIFSGNGAPPETGGASRVPYLFFMNNLIDESGFAFGGYLIDGYSANINDNGSNITNQQPAFVDQAGGDFRPKPSSPAVDAGAPVRTHENGFKYVDVDGNGAYEPKLDVIVKLSGYSPSSADWVVIKDMAGNRRFRGDGIDMGCYEYPPPSGTVVTFK